MTFATTESLGRVRSAFAGVPRIPHSAIRIPQSYDPGKLAAWLSASHVEKAPKKKAPTP